MKLTYLLSSLVVLSGFQACISQNSFKSEGQQYPNISSKEFNHYWYSGKAELNSYELKQARYGEVRDGQAVLVFVTEDFLIQPQVKKDYETEMPHTSVLKTNFIRKFVTGIYDYSMMSSVFSPVNQKQMSPPIKSTTSSQEWCGHTWLQFNRRSSGYEVAGFSYFQKEGDVRRVLNQNLLEDGFWNQIRINPDLIPQGNQKVIPSSQYLRLAHKEIKAYEATINLSSYQYNDMIGNNLQALEVNYSTLDRNIIIVFEKKFPHQIVGWKEKRKSGNQIMETVAKQQKTIRSAYWSQNQNKDEYLRDSLNLTY